MQTKEMIQALRQKFSTLALEQIVSLEKPNVFDMEALTDTEIEKIYFRFFPKPPTAEQIAVALSDELELKRLRSIILADAQYLGLYQPNNWQKFNAFMKEKSVLKKPLNAYKIDEFPLLIKQFKSMKAK